MKCSKSPKQAAEAGRPTQIACRHPTRLNACETDTGGLPAASGDGRADRPGMRPPDPETQYRDAGSGFHGLKPGHDLLSAASAKIVNAEHTSRKLYAYCSASLQSVDRDEK